MAAMLAATVATAGCRRHPGGTAPIDNQTVLPFTGVKYPHGVAVDNSGTVYVTDSNRNQVAPASASPDLLPQAISQHARPEK